MTNQDLVSAMQTYGNKDEVNKAKKKIENAVTNLQIYGPPSGGMSNEPSSTDKRKGKSDTSGSYPQIYGPDSVIEPGVKPRYDNTADDYVYDVNPDLQKAFPTDGAPQPFLANFSKFQG